MKSHIFFWRFQGVKKWHIRLKWAKSRFLISSNAQLQLSQDNSYNPVSSSRPKFQLQLCQHWWFIMFIDIIFIIFNIMFGSFFFSLTIICQLLLFQNRISIMLTKYSFTWKLFAKQLPYSNNYSLFTLSITEGSMKKLFFEFYLPLPTLWVSFN